MIAIDSRTAVPIALDRQEKATENGQDVPYSAVQYVQNQLGLQVCAIARLKDLLHYLAAPATGSAAPAAGTLDLQLHYQTVLAYRERYGVD